MKKLCMLFAFLLLGFAEPGRCESGARPLEIPEGNLSAYKNKKIEEEFEIHGECFGVEAGPGIRYHERAEAVSPKDKDLPHRFPFNDARRLDGPETCI